jgi:hypothetical protein
MRINPQMIVAVIVGSVLYLAFGPTIEMSHGFVECLVLADIFARVVVRKPGVKFKGEV